MTSCAAPCIGADCIQWVPVNCRAMPGKTATALVAEDDDQISYILRFILEREGYQVELAPDGRTAQQLIAALHPPAIAILDVMLPHVDGYQLLARLRATAGWEKVPVI